MQPEKRSDGWYLGERKIKVGDTLLVRSPKPSQVTREDIFDDEPLPWEELNVTEYVLEHAYMPQTMAGPSIDEFCHRGYDFAWPD